MANKNMLPAALLILRITVGIIFIAHGAQKVFGTFGGPGIKGFSESLSTMGFTMPIFWAWIVALSEFLGGLFLIAGIIPRISAGLIGITMIVAILKVHGPNGLFSSQGGFEYQLMLLAVSICIVLLGAGKYSLWNKF